MVVGTAAAVAVALFVTEPKDDPVAPLSFVPAPLAVPFTSSILLPCLGPAVDGTVGAVAKDCTLFATL